MKILPMDQPLIIKPFHCRQIWRHFLSAAPCKLVSIDWIQMGKNLRLLLHVRNRPRIPPVWTLPRSVAQSEMSKCTTQCLFIFFFHFLCLFFFFFFKARALLEGGKRKDFVKEVQRGGFGRSNRHVGRFRRPSCLLEVQMAVIVYLWSHGPPRCLQTPCQFFGFQLPEDIIPR